MKSEFMRKAAELALRGKGYTKANPCVGAVVVKNGEIISSGWHETFGGAHAEKNALEPLGKYVKGSELYVTLEPCSTFGKTPPCTELIIKSKIKKVYIGAVDPNPINQQKGIEALKDAGIEVEVGVESELCNELIADFRKYITERLPYVTLKVAQSLDGKIAAASGESKWITSEVSRVEVSHLRNMADAVLVGIKTALSDNPRLTSRFAASKPRPQPVRVVLDSFARLPVDSNLANVKMAPTLLCHGEKADKERLARLADIGVQTVCAEEKDGLLNLRDVLSELAGRGIMNLLAEGGAGVFTSILENRLADKAIIYMAPILLGGANSAVGGFKDLTLKNAPRLSDINISDSGGDVRIEGKLL
jgi:diaminohydroxyphosphoribosylaminopyrimidine deaminase/5-amino-6-(5-phosphoribosylamino)uracil reductase